MAFGYNPLKSLVWYITRNFPHAIQIIEKQLIAGISLISRKALIIIVVRATSPNVNMR